jgi:ABC-2 type transport system ATP-binding protein
MLGDPQVLVLDEPANGLDPEGIAWMRRFLRQLADQGRSVLVSSHVLSEVQQLVDHVVIINRGRLVRQATLAELAGTGIEVLVRTPQGDELLAVLQRAVANGTRVERRSPDSLTVVGMQTDEIGHLAFTEHIELYELSARTSDLEQAFFALTSNSQEEM